MLERLADRQRPPGSRGEQEAADLLAADLEARGARVRIEHERVHGTYWIPIGLACALGALAAARRITGALVAGLAAASVSDDLSIGRRPLRYILGQRVARNVIDEYGPAGDAPTLVIPAHHDGRPHRIRIHPAAAKLVARVAGWLIERLGATPAPMWGAIAGPVTVALGQLLGLQRLRRLGGALSIGYAAAVADIWRSPAVPAANDNLSGVCALLTVAGTLGREPPAASGSSCSRPDPRSPSWRPWSASASGTSPSFRVTRSARRSSPS